MPRLRLHRERLTDLSPADLAGLAGGIPTDDCFTGDYTATIRNLPTKTGCPVTGDPCLFTPPVAATTKVGCS